MSRQKDKREDPEHSILPRAWEHEVVGINLQLLADPPFLDLTLRRAGVLKTLRFARPHEVAFVQPPGGHHGLVIADVSARGLEGIRVRVYDFEPENALSFWASDVVEVFSSSGD
jgi:hypothetical protein